MLIFVEILLAVCVFLLGASLESAINCMVYRIFRHKSWVHGRSVCEHCGKTLQWWQVIPVISALFLRGRCSFCGYRFGYRYTILEASAGVVAVAISLVVQRNVFMAATIAALSLLVSIVVAVVHEARNSDS